jgi:isopentenyldiphosphate isomerase
LYFVTSRGSSEEIDDINGNKKAAKRPILYELGINVPIMDKIQYITRVHYKASNQQFDSEFGEHEIEWWPHKDNLENIKDNKSIQRFL